MADDVLLIRRGPGLVPADEDARQAIEGMPHNKPLRAKITQARNVKFHRKAMALIRLTYDYYSPRDFITDIERATVRNMTRYMREQGISEEAAQNLADGYLNSENAKRQALPTDVDFTEFRKDITIRAGFYDTIMTIAGPRRVAKSWSFAKMDNTEFERMYRQLMNACWKIALNQTFETMADAEKAATELLRFDG